jgi:hypothetical protein
MRRLIQTDLAPLYFQFHGHSLTIIGVEINDKTVNLLVFDPAMSSEELQSELTRPDFKLDRFRISQDWLRRKKDYQIVSVLTRKDGNLARTVEFDSNEQRKYRRQGAFDLIIP